MELNLESELATRNDQQQVMVADLDNASSIRLRID
jgi:hypothetical protein